MRDAGRFRNVHWILATAAGLAIFVSLALGWLGWRLLAQEETLQQQQARSRLEQRADALTTGFLRRIEEKKAWLSALESSTSPPGDGAVLVRFSGSAVQAQPAGSLIYDPAPPPPVHIDAALFAEASKLEFQTIDLRAAAAELTKLAAAGDAAIRAEALLRLARVEVKSGRISDALATYARLRDEARMGPAEEPYGLSSRLARCDLLASSGQDAKAREEASALAADLESGRWTISKATFASLYPKVRRLAGQTPTSPALNVELAIAEAVESAWDEWQIIRRSGARPAAKFLHRSDAAPVLMIIDANAERMAALIYAGNAMRDLGLSDASAVDENGRTIFGTPPETTQMRLTRSLAAAGLPWRIQVIASSDESGDSIQAFSKERRTYLVFAVSAIVALVSLACYAMARGVIREAAAARLQSDFVSAVSHEFRSPLTTLSQLTELLAEERIHEEPRRRRYFAVVQQETSRLRRLVEDLLDFGRIDAGRRPYRRERVDFTELVRNGVEDYQTDAGSNGHRIEVPSSCNPLFVEADRDAIRRVVRNLVENAVKYSPGATTVWVETDSEPHQAVLRIRDEGIGIPAEERTRIFEKFVRGDAAKKACIPGTGVGLAIVKEIVRVHDGAMELTSEVGRGSTFTIRLPLRRS